jgi:hypothetical protein
MVFKCQHIQKSKGLESSTLLGSTLKSKHFRTYICWHEFSLCFGVENSLPNFV